jgi:hypothetical protein
MQRAQAKAMGIFSLGENKNLRARRQLEFCESAQILKKEK